MEAVRTGGCRCGNVRFEVWGEPCIVGLCHCQDCRKKTGKASWSGVINAMKIDWAGQQRAPLLLIGGGKDLIADASMTDAIHRKQKKASSITALKIFDDRSHGTLMDPGWEAVADLALNWALEHATDKQAVRLGAA
jgi:pimeloyl-ACP methyl ester carboxylesterase